MDSLFFSTVFPVQKTVAAAPLTVSVIKFSEFIKGRRREREGGWCKWINNGSCQKGLKVKKVEIKRANFYSGKWRAVVQEISFSTVGNFVRKISSNRCPRFDRRAMNRTNKCTSTEFD